MQHSFNALLHCDKQECQKNYGLGQLIKVINSHGGILKEKTWSPIQNILYANSMVREAQVSLVTASLMLIIQENK